jgi:recombination protein RecA
MRRISECLLDIKTGPLDFKRKQKVGRKYMSKDSKVNVPKVQTEVSSAIENRLKSLKQFASSMNKSMGPNTVVIGRGDDLSMVISRISTGSPEVDRILGGGFPRGRIVEIYGPEASGKSTICFSTIVQVQKEGGGVGYVDVEHALDRSYLEKLGINFDQLVISQPDNAEQALEIAEKMVESGLFDLVVVDSVAALVPKKELEGDMGDAQMGIVARLMGQALRKMTASVSDKKTVLVFINQLRQKIGVMYGNPETTSGGNALKFFASVRLDVRRTELIKDGENVVGQKMKIKTAKIKVAPPFQTTEVSLIFGVGFDQITGVYEEAVSKRVLTKAGGSHYWMGDKAKKMAGSRSEMINLLKTKPDLLNEVKELNAVTEFPTESAEEEA